MIVYKKNHIITFKRLTNQNVFNGVTLKPFNFRESYVSEKMIELNYDKIQTILNYSFKKIIKPKQTHSNNIAIVNNSNIDNKFENVDGIVTNLKNVLLAIALADCQGH